MKWQGALRWKHEASDFYDEGEVEYSDQIGSERAMHLGEVSWNDFRHSVMQQLPHSWFRREVTIKSSSLVSQFCTAYT